MKNKVRFGLSNVHIAFRIADVAGVPQYETPIPLLGAVSLTTDPEGEEFKYYADNIAYYAITNNDGYTGDLAVALIPKLLAVGFWGWRIDNNGALVEVANGVQREFALLGQYEGDKEGGRVAYLNAKASRPSTEYTTKEEGVSVTTETMPITIQPVKLGDEFITRSLLDKSDNLMVYANFFNEVYIPIETTTIVSKTSLAAEIAVSAKLIEGDYTVESWLVFADAKTNANTVNANEAATQIEVNNALTTLKNARLALVAAV